MRSDLRLRLIDIGDGRTAVARQYEIRGVPSLVLYEGRKRIANDTRQVVAKLDSL